MILIRQPHKTIAGPRKAIKVMSAVRPKLRGRGRTWDTSVLFVNGVKTDFWYDSTWGKRAYFTLDKSKWYSITVFDLDKLPSYGAQVEFRKDISANETATTGVRDSVLGLGDSQTA